MILSLRRIGTIALLLITLASCSGTDNLSSASTQPVATTSPPTTSAPTLVTLDDVMRAVGSPTELQDRSYGAHGNFSLGEARSVRAAEARKLFSEPKGVAYGFSQKLALQSVNDNDPMTTHDARAVVRVIVFESEEEAKETARVQGISFGVYGTNAQRQKSVFDGDKTGISAGRWHVNVGGSPPCLQDGLRQQGRLVVWVVLRNKICRNLVDTWGINISRHIAEGIIERNPGLDD